MAVNNYDTMQETTPINNKNPKLQLSLLIENKGSAARDHLANERTFLAWLRTSLALVTIGIAISQLGKFSKDKSKDHTILGSSYILAGMAFVGFGLFRYFYIQNSLVLGKFPASRVTIVLGVLFIALIIGTLIYTFISDLSA